MSLFFLRCPDVKLSKSKHRPRLTVCQESVSLCTSVDQIYVLASSANLDFWTRRLQQLIHTHPKTGCFGSPFDWDTYKKQKTEMLQIYSADGSAVFTRQSGITEKHFIHLSTCKRIKAAVEGGLWLTCKGQIGLMTVKVRNVVLQEMLFSVNSCSRHWTLMYDSPHHLISSEGNRKQFIC